MPSNQIDTPPPHFPGAPARPKGLTRATRNAWTALCDELAGKLFQDDGERLLELIQARADRYKAAGERKEAGRRRAAELLAQLSSRKQLTPPEPAPDTGLPR